MKMWVRNRVIEINRLADASLWRNVESKDTIVDIGARKGDKVEHVGPNSEWILGQDWMRGPIDEFPVLTAAQLVLSSRKLQDASKESIVVVVVGLQ